MSRYSRRTLLKTAGVSLAAATVPATATAEESESEWQAVETPIDSTLHDIRDTATNPHAVAESGILIERTAAGWETVLRGGPTGSGNDLYGAAVTDDGERLWIVGDSGVVGEYDVTTGNLVDRSAPMDVTNQFNSVAVTGPAGDADVYVVDDSGLVYYSFENGEEGTWDDLTPGSGSGMPAVDFFGDRSGHIIDTNGTVFETDDGTTWEAIGVEDADTTFGGLDSDGFEDVTVVGDGGAVLSYDGVEWRSQRIGDTDLRDVETDSGTGYTVGSGGTVFELTDGEWRRMETPIGENLLSVATGDVDLVVGASGAVLER
ncbi:MAG: hypothetical protein PPP58_07030 [Natronomonas sp.]